MLEPQVLFGQLRRWRRQKAHKEGVPAYVVRPQNHALDVTEIPVQARDEPRHRGGLCPTGSTRYDAP